MKMKKLFYVGIISIILFEIANVYFIMPMPGSQEMNSIEAAYFLYSWRWLFRGLFGLMALLGLKSAFSSSKWLPIIPISALVGIAYETNFVMAADTMFYQPKVLAVKNIGENKVENDRIVIGVTHEGHAKAYPIQYLGYHHQVRDTLGNKSIMVTYCTVCRTGRVYEPIVNGKLEDFRLVGMDHFNAMFEDKTTKSWWQQATGTAITGVLKGQQLPEVFSQQMALSQWLLLHPNTQIMQADSTFKEEYEAMETYDLGKGRGKLTGTDSLSWKRKSWVIGIEIDGNCKAYDWNRLVKERVINDFVGDKPIFLAVAADNKSFVAYERFSPTRTFSIQNDTLILDTQHFTLGGELLDAPYRFPLKPIKAHHIIAAYDVLFGNNFRFHTEGYYQRLVNVPVSPDINSTYAYINDLQGFANRALVSDGKGQNVGLDVTLEKIFQKGTFFILSTSVFNSTYQPLNGKTYSTQYNSKFSAAFIGGKEWQAGSKGIFQLGGKIIFNGGQPITPLANVQDGYSRIPTLEESQPYTINTQTYFRPDLRLAYRHDGTKSAYTIALDVQNVALMKNIDGTRREYDPTTNKWVDWVQGSLVPVISWQIDFH